METERVAGKVSKGIVSVTLGGKEIATFDLEGRLLYYAVEGSAYRRSIHNEFYRLDWVGSDRVVEKVVNPHGLAERAYDVAKIARDLTEESELREALRYVTERDVTWLSKDAERARRLFRRISIVPPDQYFSTYLQLSIGCAWNKCSFCSLYKDREYSVKSIDEFSAHLEEVKEFFGRGLQSRRSVFLGDANAINIRNDLLKDALRMIKENLDLPVYSFVDGFTTPKKKASSDFQMLHGLGLQRVYIGVESGDDKVLSVLGKPMRVEEAVQFVRRLKDSKINVGVIFLAGAGGQEMWKSHVVNTVSAIARMGLGHGDIIYLSPLVENEEHKSLMKSMDLGIMTEEEKIKQMAELSERIRNATNLEGCPVVRYDIRESFIS